MTEFLHEVVKKREREMEYRTLRMPFPPRDFFATQRTGYRFGFSVPTLTMPPNNEIIYRTETELGITVHSVTFPNVGGWVQTTVMINTPPNMTLGSLDALRSNAWLLLAGHPCRPNYTWSNNSYVCRACSDVHYTHGSEWISA